ncbi:unnamed protein product [Prunus armeniaca]
MGTTNMLTEAMLSLNTMTEDGNIKERLNMLCFWDANTMTEDTKMWRVMTKNIVNGDSGVSVDIIVSYLNSAYSGEEVDVEAKALRVGKAVGVALVELRKKKTCKIIS